MAELYSLGIGLVAVDRASAPINNADAALSTLSGTATRAAKNIMPSLESAIGSMGSSLASVGNLMGDGATEAGVLAGAFSKATEAAHEMHMVLTGRSLDDDILRVTALWGAFTGLVKKTTGALSKAASAIEGFGDTGISRSIVEMEDATQKMAMGMGQGGAAASGMRNDVLNLVAATQFSTSEVLGLANGLHNTGQALGSFSAETQASMIALNAIFGVTGEDIGRMSVLTDQFGGSLQETLDDTAAFQKNFGLPGMFKELPGIVDFARESLTKYGDQVSGGGRAIMANTQQMAGVYAKAFGTTIAQAVGQAQETLTRFMGASKNFRRVFLGLESDFDPLTKAFQEVGVPIFEVRGLLQNAQTDVLGFATRTRNILGGLDPFRRSRMIEQLRDELPAATMALITDTNAYTAAISRQSEASERNSILGDAGRQSFEELSSGMLDTTKELKAMWLNMKEVMKVTLVQTGLLDIMKNIFKKAKDQLVIWNASLKDFVNSDKFQGWVQSVAPILETLGSKVLLAGTAISEFAGAWGGVAAAIGSGGGVLTALKLFGKLTGGALPGAGALGGILGKLGGAFKLVGKFAFKTVGKLFPLWNMFSAVSTAFKDMGEVMGDPGASGMEKLQALLRGTLKGVASFFDGMLMGLPSMLLDKFFPDLERKFDVGIAGLFSGFGDVDIGEAASKMWDDFMRWTAVKLGGLSTWIKEKLPEWKPMLMSWGKSIGGAVGGLTKMLFEGLWWAVKNLNVVSLSMGFIDIMKNMFGEAGPGVAADAQSTIGDVLLDMFMSTGQLINSAVLGMLDGFLGAFGSSFDEAVIQTQLAWLIIKNSTREVWVSMKEMVMGAVDSMILTVGDIVFGLQVAWARVAGVTQKAWEGIGNTIKGVINSFIISPINAMVDGVAQAFGQMMKAIIDPIRNTFRTMPAIMRRNIPGFSAINDQLNGMSSAANEMSTATANVVPSLSHLDETGFAARMAEIDAQTTSASTSIVGQADALGTLIAAQRRGRVESAALETEANSQEETRLGQALTGLKVAREANDQRGRDARAFQSASQAGYDAIFAGLRRDAAGKLTERQTATAQRSLTSALDESLRSITTRVREGALNTSQAEVEFQRASSAAIARVIRESQAANAAEAAQRRGANVRPGDAAARANAPQFVGARIDPAMWQQVMASARTSGGSVQQVDVNFRGGSGLGRALSNDARVIAGSNP